MMTPNKMVFGKLTNGEKIELDSLAQEKIKANGIGVLADYQVDETIANKKVIKSVIRLMGTTTYKLQR